MDIKNDVLATLTKLTNLNKVLLYAYPKDDTPGCTIEANDFSSLYTQFTSLGIDIIGISPDPVSSHDKFIAKYNLQQKLISDLDLSIMKYLDAYGEKNMYGKKVMGVKRSTFLIDLKTKKIIQEWKNVRAKGHADKVLRELKQ